ncbi:MAG: hypothetical protein Q8K64_04920 [Sediminibacterium sp.]|nr:hypothetical protein [Sediminibacterium sp.]
MKKYLLILMLLASASFCKLSAQQLNYQGIARNVNGVAMAFQEISLRLTIRDGSSTGISVYSETRLVRTNQFGLFTIVIGSPGASNVSGSFVTINWITGNKFLQVEIDPAGGSAFQLAGVSELQSVPYAYFAAAAYPVGLAGGDLRGSTYPDPIIAPKVVTNGKLADTSVSTIKIIDRNVTNIKIANPYIYFNDLPVQLGQGQYFIIDSLGSNFNILSYDSIHKFNIPSASATKRGLLKSNDWTYFNNKLNLSDTAAMLLGYTRVNRFLDTATALQARIQNKLNITDTIAMLIGYTRVNRFLDTATALQSRIQTKVNFADTANMLNNYLRKNFALLLQDTASAFSVRPLNNRFLDTAKALQIRIQTKEPLLGFTPINKADSLSGGYTTWVRTKKVVDSLGALKLNLSDTAAMLIGYTRENRFLDTARALQIRIQTKEPLLGFTPINKADSLSGGYTTWVRTKKVVDSLGALSNKWSIIGNSGLDSTINFLGTTENQPLRFKVNGTWAGELNPLSSNTSLGFGAAQNAVASTRNTAFGFLAMNQTASASGNKGEDNTAIGQGALASNISGDNNTALGQGALLTSTGTSNTAVGQAALNKITTDNNTAIGRSALELAAGIKSEYNTALGYIAGRHFGPTFTDLASTQTTLISKSVMLGSNTRTLTNNSQNEIVIGYDAVGNGSNTVQLGNASVAKVNTNGTMNAKKFIGNSAIPPISLLPGNYLGTGSVSPTIDGNDVAGYISFITGTGQTDIGDFINVTFSSAYINPPVVIIQPVINSGTRGLATSIYCLPSATSLNTFTISTGTVLTANTSYQIAYHVLGR